MNRQPASRCYLLPALLLVLPGAALAEPLPGEIGQRLDRIERLLESRALLDMHDQLQRLQSEVRQLRGEIESQQRRLDTLDQRLEEMETAAVPASGPGMTDVDAEPPITGLDTADDEMPPADTVVDAEEDSVAMLPPLPEETDAGVIDEDEISAMADHDPAEARTAYNRAFDLLKDAHYEQAIAALKAYLQKYPGGADAGNAQYWLGEAYYVTRDYEQAIDAYRKLVERHPGNSQVPQAMLKIGYSQHELGDIASARTTLQNVRQRYAGSTVARLAEDRLQRLTGAN